MSNYSVSGASLADIADAIRTKGGTSASLMFPDGFLTAIQNISTGGTLVSKSITENGTYDPADDNADGYSSVEVNVAQQTSPFVKVGSYTLQEAWEGSKTGFQILQEVLDGYLDSKAIVYVLIFNNNTLASSYRGDAIICITNTTSVSGLTSASGASWKNNFGSIGTLGSTTRASQGTVIDIYRAVHS